MLKYLFICSFCFVCRRGLCPAEHYRKPADPSGRRRCSDYPPRCTDYLLDREALCAFYQFGAGKDIKKLVDFAYRYTLGIIPVRRVVKRIG